MSTIDLRFLVRLVPIVGTTTTLREVRILQYRTRPIVVNRDFTERVGWGMEYGGWSDWRDVREEAE